MTINKPNKDWWEKKKPTKEEIENFNELSESKREFAQRLENEGYDIVDSLSTPFRQWVLFMRILPPLARPLMFLLIPIGIPVALIWFIVSLF